MAGSFPFLPDVERRALVLEMRRTRHTFKEIGDALGVKKQAAQQMYERTLKELVTVPAQEMIGMEVARLDAEYAIAWGMANDPEKPDGIRLAALDRCARTNERRAKLLGLDAPTRTEVDQTHEVRVVFADSHAAQADDAASVDSGE